MDFLKHPETEYLRITGQEVPVLLCGYGLKKAAAAGVDLLAEFAQGVGEGAGIEAVLSYYARLLWVARLPFDDAPAEAIDPDGLTFADLAVLRAYFARQTSKLAPSRPDEASEQGALLPKS